MTLTYKLDLHRVNVNQRAKYSLGHHHFLRRLLSGHTQPDQTMCSSWTTEPVNNWRGQ